MIAITYADYIEKRRFDFGKYKDMTLAEIEKAIEEGKDGNAADSD